jgi:Uma2 family endonuclease
MSVDLRHMTADELFRMPRGHRRHELINGELRDMAPAGFEHGAVVAPLTELLSAFVRKARLGQVLGAETGFILARNPDTVRAPDIAFVCRSRLEQTGIPAAFFPGPPDLAVEVVSPGDTHEEVEAKVDGWLDAGAQAVWVVNPRRRTVTTYRTRTAVTVLTESDLLDGGSVLPGFSCPVRDLFPRL